VEEELAQIVALALAEVTQYFQPLHLLVAVLVAGVKQALLLAMLVAQVVPVAVAGLMVVRGVMLALEQPTKVTQAALGLVQHQYMVQAVAEVRLPLAQMGQVALEALEEPVFTLT